MDGEDHSAVVVPRQRDKRFDDIESIVRVQAAGGLVEKED